jgi:ubiquinone/menaquinone biosynthesis C-methylase UbiE
VAGLGCGIGGDAISLITSVEVIGVDWSPVRLAMAQENVRVYNNPNRLLPLQSDLLELDPL